MWLVVERFLSHAEVINFRWSDCGKRSGTIFLQSMSADDTRLSKLQFDSTRFHNGNNLLSPHFCSPPRTLIHLNCFITLG